MNHRYFHSKVTGWTMRAQVDGDGVARPGGIILKDVRHWAFNLARDIRVLGLRVFFETVEANGAASSAGSAFYALGGEGWVVGDLKAAEAPRMKPPGAQRSAFEFLANSAAAGHMSTYFDTGKKGDPFGFSLRCDMLLPAEKFLADHPNCETAAIAVSQVFLFSHYANQPPHEPLGVLWAARCHPMLSYELKVNEEVDKSKPRLRVASIRFDYRLHLSLDGDLEAAFFGETRFVPQQAGLFRDTALPAIGNAISRQLEAWRKVAQGWAMRQILPLPSDNAQDELTIEALRSGTTFEAAEKPLVLEVVAPGLEGGLSRFLDQRRQRACWDNLHWWARRARGQPSAPGAFHAAHCHWRWGDLVKIFFPHEGIDYSGVPNLQRLNPAADDGTAVDPGIWMQTIRVAVTKYRKEQDATTEGVALEKLVPPKWSDLFTASGPPQSIKEGEDLVFWYSVEIPREFRMPDFTVRPRRRDSPPLRVEGITYEAAKAGTIFLHGIFFGHEAETGKAGSQTEEYFPTSKDSIEKAATWVRTAEGDSDR